MMFEGLNLEASAGDALSNVYLSILFMMKHLYLFINISMMFEHNNIFRE
jgi:hypothetical protein